MTEFIYDSLFPNYKYSERIVSSFVKLNGKEKEVPLSILSYQITNWQSYRVHAYNRPAIAYKYLREILGDSLFFEGLHNYMKLWHGKHPVPFDFFASIEKGSGKDLKWFFIPWFFNSTHADMGIETVSDNIVKIKNLGGLPLPIRLTVFFEDLTEKTIYYNASIWKDNSDMVKIKLNEDKIITKIILGNNDIPDINEANNIFVH
jgi:hypothetical protein